jgi:hypothetical protein
MSVEWWNSDSVPSFRALALEFIALIENREALSAAELLHRTHLLLPALYGGGLALPEKPEDAFEDEPDDELPAKTSSRDAERCVEVWKPLFRSLETQLGQQWNFYREVFDPYEDSTEPPVTGSLADDLCDIYLDLVRGEELWARGEFDAAVWNWQFHFQCHWGEHATGALRALHALAERDLAFPQSKSLDV